MTDETGCCGGIGCCLSRKGCGPGRSGRTPGWATLSTTFRTAEYGPGSGTSQEDLLVDRIADIWGTRTPFSRGEPWPVRVDLRLADGLAEKDVDRWVTS
ncbi:MAG: hypothetical protein QOE37_1019, partial [Microbacteriaceae bacterium]|nr:hypothetical protein [Microbacteriaceae bacterium]